MFIFLYIWFILAAISMVLFLRARKKKTASNFNLADLIVVSFVFVVVGPILLFCRITRL